MWSSLNSLYDRVFARRLPIANTDDLANFLDQQAAFLVQKGIYEYSRARAGHYSKVLFREQGFQEAVSVARWQAYPLGLAMVAELVEGVLRPSQPGEQAATHRGVTNLALYVFDRYPVPQGFSQDAWRSLRSELAIQLERIALHPRKRAMDIPEPYAKAYFKLMPIHKSLRGSDFSTTKSYLRITMCNIHDELTRRMDADAMGAQLRTNAG